MDKFTEGYVKQTFDPKTKRCISQEFVAGDDVEWEPTGQVGFSFYHPFDMVQPNNHLEDCLDNVQREIKLCTDEIAKLGATESLLNLDLLCRRKFELKKK